MKTHIIVFVLAFAAGAVISLAARTALHRPYEEAPPAQATQTPPHLEPPPRPDTAGGADKPAAQRAVNTICPICGMDVDPAIKPAEYKGQLVGFGCRACPPKFARDPDRYGAAALKNQVVED